MAPPNIANGNSDHMENNSKLNQSIVSENNRYSRFLDE